MASGIISSSSRSSSNSSLLSHNPRRTMEEVWKDINPNSFNQDLSVTPSFSLHHHGHRRQHHHQLNYFPAASNSGRGIILQEFLSGAWKEPNRALTGDPQVQPPHTALSLNSGQLLCDRRSNYSRPGIDAFFDACSDRANGFLAPPPGMAACLAKHSLEEKLDGSFGNDDERRKKRMIKNRESAARSRARKQAYTNELERGVAQLVRENKRLERQCEELRVAIAAQASATRSKLQKTSSATF